MCLGYKCPIFLVWKVFMLPSSIHGNLAGHRNPCKKIIFPKPLKDINLLLFENKYHPFASNLSFLFAFKNFSLSLMFYSFSTMCFHVNLCVYDAWIHHYVFTNFGIECSNLIILNISPLHFFLGMTLHWVCSEVFQFTPHVSLMISCFLSIHFSLPHFGFFHKWTFHITKFFFSCV